MKDSEKKSSWLIPVSLILIFVIIIVVTISLLNGKTITTGEFEGTYSLETLICKSETIPYSIFAFDDSNSKSLKINVVFKDGHLNSISLLYKLNYYYEDELSFSEARNHAEMNKNFKNDGMGPDSLSAKYGVMSDGLQFSIYTDEEEGINNKTLRYFMLDDIDDIEKVTIEKTADYYNNIGLNCEIKTNKEVNEN